jgi:23S rRNA (adenine2503-C2)-methyltransferase
MTVRSVRPSAESKPLPLVMTAPRRGKPPRHIAHRAPEEVRAVVGGRGV